jgi:hypothetical protein
MNGLSGWLLSPQLEALVKERQLDVSSLEMVGLYRRDMWDHRAAFHIASMSVARKVPMEVVSAQFTLKLMPSLSPQDMALRLQEVLSTVPMVPVQVVLSSSSMLVLCE